MAEVELKQETVQDSPKVVVMRIVGEVDESNGRQVETYFNELVDGEKPHDVLMDLSGLTFAGSGFFGSLLFWKEEIVKGGGQLVLFSLRPEIASTMRIFSLDKVVTISEDQQSAYDRVTGA